MDYSAFHDDFRVTIFKYYFQVFYRFALAAFRVSSMELVNEEKLSSFFFTYAPHSNMSVLVCSSFVYIILLNQNLDRCTCECVCVPASSTKNTGSHKHHLKRTKKKTWRRNLWKLAQQQKVREFNKTKW